MEPDTKGIVPQSLFRVKVVIHTPVVLVDVVRFNQDASYCRRQVLLQPGYYFLEIVIVGNLIFQFLKISRRCNCDPGVHA
jgi:hypothetical protein